MTEREPLAALLAAATLIACSTGCGGSAVTRDTTPTRATHAAEPAPRSAMDVGLTELSARLRRVGATAIGAPTGGFLAGGESATIAVSVPAGSCVTVTTLASPGVHDLDATLFAPSGDVLAEDVAEDAHPTVQLCAPGAEPRRAFVVVRAYSGAGAYLAATFASPRSALSAVAGVVGGTPGIAGDTSSEVADDARLRDHALGATRRGFAPRGEARIVPLAATQSVWVPLSVAASECVSVVALAERGLEDVDAQLLDSDGAELVRDVGTGRDATVQHCAERASELVLVLSAVRGQGSARVVVFAGPVTRVGGASGLWLGQPAADRVAMRSIDTSSAEARARAIAARFTVRGHAVRATLSRGGAWRTTTRAEAGSCVRAEVSAGPGIARPYVMISSEGVPLAECEGRGEGEPAIAHVCTRTPIELELTLVARSGSGDAALTLSTRASQLPSDSAAHAEALRLDERARALAAGNDASAPELASSSIRAELQVPVDAGSCARVVFISDDASRVRLEATRAGQVISSDVGEAARVGVCADRDAGAALTVSAVSPSGAALSGTWLVSRKRVDASR